MQDWANSVSKQAWSRPLTKHQDREKLLEPMEMGECGDNTSCWGCLKKQKHRYLKVKPS